MFYQFVFIINKLPAKQIAKTERYGHCFCGMDKDLVFLAL